MHQPHDKLFKAAFSEPETAASFLKSQLSPALAARLDWSFLSVVPGTFIDEQLQASASDLLYRIPLDGSPALVYVLFEHQRQEDRWMALRLLRYMLRIWEAHRRDFPDETHLPPILPLVVAQNAVPWKSSVQFFDLIGMAPELAPEIRPFTPDFGYQLLQLAELPFDKIYGTPQGILTLRILKAEQFGKLLDSEVWDDALLSHVSESTLDQLLRYIFAADVDRAGFARRVQTISDARTKSTAMSLADQLRQEGRQEGRQQGRQEGQVLAKQQDVVEALEVRFGFVPEGLREEIARISDLPRLQVLLRAAIRCADLEAFVAEF